MRSSKKARLDELERSRGFCTWEDKDRLSLLPFLLTDSSGQFKAGKFYVAMLSKAQSLLLQWLNNSSKWQEINTQFKCTRLTAPQKRSKPRVSSDSLSIYDRNAERT